MLLGLLGLLGVAAVGFLPFQGVLLGLLGLLGVAAVGFLAFWALLLIWASWPFGRAAGSSWPFGLAAVGLLGLRLYLKPANFKRIIQKKERK